MGDVALILCWDGIYYFREIVDDDRIHISEYYRGIPIVNFQLYSNQITHKCKIDNYIKEIRLKKLKSIKKFKNE